MDESRQSVSRTRISARFVGVPAGTNPGEQPAINAFLQAAGAVFAKAHVAADELTVEFEILKLVTPSDAEGLLLSAVLRVFTTLTAAMLKNVAVHSTVLQSPAPTTSPTPELRPLWTVGLMWVAPALTLASLIYLLARLPPAARADGPAQGQSASPIEVRLSLDPGAHEAVTGDALVQCEALARILHDGVRCVTTSEAAPQRSSDSLVAEGHSRKGAASEATAPK